MSGRRTHAEQLLLARLAAGCSVEQAAQAAGVSVRTAYRRLAESDFQQRLAVARDELLSATLGELVGSAAEAVATLRELLSAREERVRLAAARTVLEQLLRLRETLTLAQRLAALERALESRGGRA
jgi:hypothetical protein